MIVLASFEYNADNAVNITETVVDKDISHVKEHMGDDCQYHIYTNNNEFEVYIKDYNRINIGDNVTVEYNRTFTPNLYVNNSNVFTF